MSSLEEDKVISGDEEIEIGKDTSLSAEEPVRTRFDCVMKPSVTEELIDKFDKEITKELGINNFISGIEKEEHKSEEEKKLETHSYEIKEDETENIALLESYIKRLEFEIGLSDIAISELEEKETSLQISLSRLKTETKINRNLLEQERRNCNKFMEVALMIDSEVEKNEKLEKLNLEKQSEKEENTFTTLTFNTLMLKNSIVKEEEKLRELNQRYSSLLQQKRKKLIKQAHFSELFKQRVLFEKKWTTDTQRMQEKYYKDLEKLQQEKENQQLLEKQLERKLSFVLNEDGENLEKYVQKVVSILKGREELQSGNYISVAKAIGYYTQLKDASDSNRFTVEYFKNFIKEHIEFGIFVCDFEDLPPINGDSESEMSSTTNITSTTNDKFLDEIKEEDLQLLDYMSHKHMSDYDDIEYPSKPSFNNHSLLLESSSQKKSNNPLRHSIGGVNNPVKDVLKRSIGVLSKTRQFKQYK
ncbi:hypothetical protein ABK040_010099 [Willaertia magna]